MPGSQKTREPKVRNRSVEELERLLAERSVELERRTGELALIHRIQEGIAAALGFQAIVDLAGDTLCEIFNARDISIFWWDEAAGVGRGLYVLEHGVRVEVPPVRPDPDGPMMTAFRLGRPVVANSPAAMAALRLHPLEGKARALSTAMVPIWAGDRPLGGIGLNDHDRENAFGEAEVRLLTTVAASLGVALENARLFDETAHALERQTAMAEILKVIASSPSDVQPVFDAIAGSANRLVGGYSTAVWRLLDGALHAVAFTATNPDGDAALKGAVLALAEWPFAAPIVEGATVRIGDTENPSESPPYARDLARLRGFRSMVICPLRRDGVTIGMISVTRREPGHCTEHEVALLQTFADQAVIAIENVRLFNETREALEQQTATAQVLQVISSSVADARPVFDEILSSCKRLFDSAEQGILLVGQDGRFHLGAHHGSAQPLLRQIFAGGVPTAQFGNGMASRQPLHVPDVFAADAPPWLRRIADRLGVGTYSQVLAPIAREDRAIGYLYAIRQPATGFEPKEIALLQTFAEQAVIAIENARLFNETQEALARQTATSDVLQVISESPTDVQPVFDIIAERGARLTGASYGWVFRFDGKLIHVASAFGVNPQGLEAARAAFPMPPGAGSAAARAVRDRRVVNIADVRAESDPEYTVKEIAEQAGYRAILSVPMLRDNQIVGAISVTRPEPGAFDANEIDLLQTFASQAVVAIENVRLFNETQEALEQQTATAEVLQVISNSVSDTQPVFDKILDSCQRLIDCSDLCVMTVDEQALVHLGSVRGDGGRQFAKFQPRPVEQTVIAEAMRERRVMGYPDALHGDGVPEVIRRMAARIGNFSLIIAPMVWRGLGVGALFIARRTLHAFTAKEMTLLEMFADQAVIAIENARLFEQT